MEKNPTCVRPIKASFNKEIGDLPDGLTYFGSDEQIEGLQTFLEKSQPHWGKIKRGRPKDFE